jgi:hypothetical protein
MDRVAFRIDKGGEVLAVLPDQDANLGSVTLYAHVGQHGEGDLRWIHSRTRVAKPSEYRDLARELRSLGYRLRIVKRIARRH